MMMWICRIIFAFKSCLSSAPYLICVTRSQVVSGELSISHSGKFPPEKFCLARIEVSMIHSYSQTYFRLLSFLLRTGVHESPEKSV